MLCSLPSVRIKAVFKNKKIRNKKRFESGVDPILVLLIITLSLFGTVMVGSAGYPYAHFRYGDGFFFIKKQLVFLALGYAIMIFTSGIKTEVVKRYTPAAYIFSLLLLGTTLIIGSVGNGAKRWISIGPITIQPSELAKLALVLILAYYFDRYESRACISKSKGESFIFGTMIPLLITACPIILVMLQHHLSCIIILFMIGIFIIFASGADARYLYGFSGAGVLGIGALAIFTDYTKDRITVWRNPEAYKLTGGWQTLQGLMAIGSGGLFGVGLGKSVMKHLYVSEPANDMIFAITCEELGFFGALIALLLFLLLTVRAFFVGIRSEDTFSRIVAFGIGAKCQIQVLLNVAVVTNSIPNTGISLPFFSYGGSSLLMLFFEMGILLSLSKRARAIN